MQDQLKKLKVDYVDLYLIHTPAVFKKEGELKKLWTEAEELKKEGLTKSIGVSNFRIKDLEVILADGGAVPAINQVSMLLCLSRLPLNLRRSVRLNRG